MPRGVPRIPAPYEYVRTRKCIGPCGETKAWAFFSPATYWPDGSVRTVQATCQRCQAKAVVARQADWLARNREHRRRYQREWLRRKRAQMRAERAGRGRHLPAEPFKKWLERIEAEEGSTVHLATAAGLHPDSLQKVLSRNKFVAETTAEAALCARGLMLADLYEQEDAAA